MMKAALAVFLFLVSAKLFADETITLRSDLWCPYNCDPKSDKPGFMVEIAKEVFTSKGYKIDYQILNWARAISETKLGNFNGIIGCGKDDIIDLPYAIPNIPIAQLVNYFWVLPESKWKYTDETSLHNKKIGVINDYLYGHDIDLLLKKKHSAFVEVSGEAPLKRLIQMTETKRIDAFIENPLVLEYNLNLLKKSKKSFKSASRNVVSDKDLYICFSTANKNKGELYAKILGEGMQELRKNGRLKIILARYGLTDWEK